MAPLTPKAPLKPIVLHGMLSAPNPYKVLLFVRALNLPYTLSPLGHADVKSPTYLSLNPNGRMPTIHDPNTNLTISESGAIVDYLVSTYDTEKKLSFEFGTKEHWQAMQWLHFQMSGQGPYFGQAFWFLNYHHEKVDSAIQRYVNEVKRVCGVLEGWLAGTLGAAIEGDGNGDANAKGEERKWLVGDKCSFADLAWLPWHGALKMIIEGAGGEGVVFEQEKEFPRMHEWMQRMREVEGVKEAEKMRDEARAKMLAEKAKAEKENGKE
ncbi:hypothetical protein AJ79_03768 [Helicocarpus griseus UAMH5409]|uniref:Glutathione S-transferase n=1 Tax=Helicocarpus griseus UAMH5409 TaxID=1447875 RepID=A0A2B7XW27_9EURO|nr:hypothetical protein AJ79_03768 [Helicocarpus griseus UAMH5409]